MAMNCDNTVKKFKTAEANSKAELKRLGIIDKFLNILDYPNFVKKNGYWTDDAIKRFGISGKLFYEENNKALPNKEAFKIIDNSKGIFYPSDTQVTPTKPPVPKPPKQTEDIKKDDQNFGQLSLFGLDLNNNEKLVFQTNTLNAVGNFLENIGVEQRLVSSFLNEKGSIVEGAIAAANFIQGTVDIIEDINLRPSAWEKLPEEAAHWWYRLLNENSPLKKALWDSHQTALKNDELYKGKYGELVSNPEDLTEESIGQLIAEAIKRIETKQGSTTDYSFFKKFLEWINSVIDIFKNSEQDPFEVAAMKILSSDMSDLMTWQEYKKLNNIVNFSDVLTEQSDAPLDYSIMVDWLDYKVDWLEYGDNIVPNYTLSVMAPLNEGDDIVSTVNDPEYERRVIDEIKFDSKEEMDDYVRQNFGEDHDERQKIINQEVIDNQIFFDRLLNKTFRKKSRFLSKTLKKYYYIIDSQSPEPLRDWKVSKDLLEITKKLSEEEKKQIVLTNGYTNITPTLKALPNVLEKYKKNPISLSDPLKVDGAKKQELSILNSIKDMIKSENPDLKSIKAEEFVAEAHNWLEVNYLLGFANENNYLSYNVDQTFTHVKDRFSNESSPLANMTEEEITALPLEERQRIANIIGLTKKNPDVYHNKISLRFNDRYHLRLSHFNKPPSAWGNLTYFYTGDNKWKDAVLLHEIQNDNIEFLRDFKYEKPDLDTSLGTYLQKLNTDLLDNIQQIQSGEKKIQRQRVSPKEYVSLNYELNNLLDMSIPQGLNRLKSYITEKLALYESDDSIRTNPEKAQEEVEKAYLQKRRFRDFQSRGGIKSLLTAEELQELKDILAKLNVETVEGARTYLLEENQYEPGEERIRSLGDKKVEFTLRSKEITDKLNKRLQEMYGEDVLELTLEPSRKPRTRTQARQGALQSQDLNENLNYLFILSEQRINSKLSREISESKKYYTMARNATNSYKFNLNLYKINEEQFTNLIENYKYNQNLLNKLLEEQISKELQSDKNEGESENKNSLILHETKVFDYLKQEALIKKEELDKKYGDTDSLIDETLEVEMNYFTPLVHHLIQKHINQYGKEFPMYFSGYNITKLTQSNDRTALIYAGKDEVNIVDKNNSEGFEFNGKTYRRNIGGFDYLVQQNGAQSRITQQEYEKAYQQATERRAKEIKFEAAKLIGILENEYNDTEIKNLTDTQLAEGIKQLNEFKKIPKSSPKSTYNFKSNLDIAMEAIMSFSKNKPIETGAIYNAMTQVSGVNLVWKDNIKGLRGNPGGYLVDLSNYNYNTPILFGLNKQAETIEDRSIKSDIIRNQSKERNNIQDQSPKSARPPSATTLARVKQLMLEKGISLQKMLDYAEAHPDMNVRGVNALADLVEGVIAIGQGKEDVALVEEFVHIATALIELHSPKLMTQLIKNIDRYKVFKDTLARYKNIKEYQLPDGRPNIRKIKKEAIDIALKEIIVSGEATNSNYPDLFSEENLGFFQELWKTITDWIKSTLSKSYKRDGIQPFKDVAENIMSGNIPGKVSDLTNTDVYFQIDPTVQLEIDTLYDKFSEMDGDLQLLNQDTDDRHYMYKGAIRVAKSVTEKIKKPFNKKYKPNSSQEKIYEQKRMFGKKGHEYLQDFISKNLIDSAGYILKTFNRNVIQTSLPTEMQLALQKFAIELVKSYPEGTRILVENQVINTREKGMVASTTDFKAIYPSVNKEGEQILKVDTLDWKFYSQDTKENSDIIFYKQDEWLAQMGEYVKIDRNLGLETKNMGRYRMVPFLMNYTYRKNLATNDYLLLYDSIQVGSVDGKTEPSMFLMPVPSPAELIENESLEKMLVSLRSYYTSLRSKSYKGNVAQNKEELSRISAAIRNLHVKQNFDPLYLVVASFLNRANNTIKEMKSYGEDKFDKMTQEELKNRLGDLLNYEETAKRFSEINSTFLEIFDKENLTPENKKTLIKLETASSRSGEIIKEIKKLQSEFVVYLSVREGLIKEEYKKDVLLAEAPISNFIKNFVEGSKLPATLINLLVNLILDANSFVSIGVSKQLKNYNTLLENLEKSTGSSKNAFDAIAGIRDGQFQLHRKFSDDFFTNFSKALEEENRSFLLGSVDLDGYNKSMAKYIREQIAIIKQSEYSSLDDNQARAIENDKIRVGKIEYLRKKFDLQSTNFSAYSDSSFKKIYQDNLLEDSKNYSDKYNAMLANPDALAMWNYFYQVNQKAKALGYLEGKSNYFFPLVEASTATKILQSKDKFSQVGRSISELFTANIDESHAYGKTDEKTGKIKKAIPKYFTQTNKKITELSKDLNRVGPIWIESVLQYEASVNLEETLNTIVAVEQSKGSLILGNDGRILFNDKNKPMVNQDVNKNADIAEIIKDEFLYRLNQDLNMLGNIGVSKLASGASKVKEFITNKKSEESDERQVAINTKKTIRNLDALTRALAVGLRYPIAIANFVGGNLHAFIVSGNMYGWKTFLKYEVQSLNPFSFSPEIQALLQFLVPLNEDTKNQLMRENFLKKGKISALVDTYSFTDFMMWSNAYPESRIQTANALSMMENSMVRDGKIVNIRQYLMNEDSQVKYDLSYQERKNLEKSFLTRVNALKESENLFKIVKIENNEVIIPGVDVKEIIRYRTSIVEFGRKLNGQMSRENKMGFARDTVFKSFMMFKTWMPKLLGERIVDINKNIQTSQWEYGRMRVFAKTLSMMIEQRSFLITDIISGNEKGLLHLQQMLQEKRDDYYRKTGKELRIDENEFYDLIRRELSNQVKELGALVSVIALVVGSAALEPPEDATTVEKNRLRQISKQIYRIYEELSFYYNPLNFESMTKGNIMPSLSTIGRVSKVPAQFFKELFGDSDKAYPTKALIDVIPVGSQFMRDFLPFMYPELAKELGVKVPSKVRQ